MIGSLVYFNVSEEVVHNNFGGSERGMLIIVDNF